MLLGTAERRQEQERQKNGVKDDGGSLGLLHRSLRRRLLGSRNLGDDGLIEAPFGLELCAKAMHLAKHYLAGIVDEADAAQVHHELLLRRRTEKLSPALLDGGDRSTGNATL